MRTIQICNTLSARDGGPARHALEVNFALNTLDHPTQLFSMSSAPDSLLTTFKSREDFPDLAPVSGATKKEIIQAVRAADAAVVHGYYLSWIPMLVILCRLFRTPVLLMPHGALTAYDRSKKGFKKKLYHLTVGWWINRAATFIVATERESRDLKALSPDAAVIVVGAGASAPQSMIPKTTHQPLSLLSLSRIAAKKRIDLAIETLHIVRSSGIDAQLRIGGAGEAQTIEGLYSLAKSLGVSDHVHFVGQVEGSEKENLFELSDVFLLLSEDENFGIGLAEALARGLPAVTTRAVESAQGLSSEYCERLESRDPGEAAAAVLRLRADYRKRSDQARSAAIERFSWLSVAKRWISAIEAISR